MIGVGAGPFDYIFQQALRGGGQVVGSPGTMPAAPQGVQTGLLAPVAVASAATGGGLNDAQRRYMDTNYTGKWDQAYWTPDRVAAAFGDVSNGTAQGPTGPVYPSVIPFSGPTAGLGAALGAMMGGGNGTAGQPTRDIRRYGMGPEHLFFSGANGNPYGLAAATGVTPQQLMQADMLQQVLDAIRGLPGSNTFGGYLGYATGDGGVGGGFGGTAGDGFGGPNGDAGIGDAGIGGGSGHG